MSWSPVAKSLTWDETFDTLINPILIVEVLSTSTKDYDLDGKFELYRSIPSLLEYLTISQERFSVQQWGLLSDGWTLKEYIDPLAAILLRSLPELQLRMTEIYDKVNWPSEN